MKLAIIAGGKGTRLGLKDIPKPMVDIGGKPLLERQVELARRYGIKEIFILSGHLSEVIRGHFGDGGKFGVKITHVVEDSPMGTAGAVLQLRGKADGRFMVFYGDTILDVDLGRLMAFDAAAPSLATLLVHPNDHPFDSDLLDADSSGFVTAFHPKPRPEGSYYRNLVNAGLYILDPGIFGLIPEGRPSDFGKDIFPAALASGGRVRAYRSAEYIKDMGTPERFEKTRRDFLEGKVARLNMANPRKAIFLDRDGVINREVGDLRRPEQFELLPGVAEAVGRINRSGFLAIVVTNQPGIAKGFYTAETLDEIHRKMDSLLGAAGAYVDGLYYCPHHPERGFPGEVPELKIDCECRKPKPLMLQLAARDLNVDMAGSYMIGDRYTDVMAGKRAAVGTVLLRTGAGGSDKALFEIEADRTFDSLSEAVDAIIGAS
jgi:mannose-1-phosphate guanylyltransferase/phosphomannomutase